MAQAHISIGSEEISSTLWSEIEVHQALNAHWRCRIQLRNTLDDRPRIEDLIGLPLKIETFNLLGAANTIFHGFIVSAELIYEVTGSFGALIEAYSYTWKLDQAHRHNYFKKATASTAAQQVVAKGGMTLSGAMPAGKELSYAQWEESDFDFVLQLVDDTEAWLRPSVHGDDPGIEVQTSFQDGPTLEWREGEYGLLEWRAGASIQPLKMQGNHYDPLPMQSTEHSDVTDQVGFSSAVSGLVSAVQNQGGQLPAASVPERHRSLTQEDYQGRLQRESRRALASSVVCSGVSRESQVRAGDAVTIAGLPGVDASYGVIECTHRWTTRGYENQFSATPAQRWSQKTRPDRPSLTGLYPARVTANHDPHNQGRIQVQYWWQQQSQTTWARLISSHAGADRGSLILPEVGDEVAITFEAGDPERPYILGSLWNGIQQPPTQGFWEPGAANAGEFAANNIKRFVTKSGHRLTAVDTSGQETLSMATPKSTRLVMTEKANETGRPTIVIESSGDIILSAPNGRIHFVSQTFSREIG